MVRHRGGVPRYSLKCRIKGRQHILTIGRHAPGGFTPTTARREAIRLLGRIRDGRDPAAERDVEKADPTLEEFAERYKAEFAASHKKPRTRSEDERLLRLHLLPRLGRLRLGEIDRAAVARVHTAMVKTPVSANRAIALLSAILGWAENVGVRQAGSNPCRSLEEYPEQARERLLSPEELARLGAALVASDAAGGDWRATEMVRLLLFTGARRGEIRGLRWEWIDRAAARARLPDSKTGPKTLYFSEPALEVLARLPRIEGNPHVIPGDRRSGEYQGLQKAWQRLRAQAGLPDVHLHDLRHAFASAGVAAGDSLFLVGRLLGHRQSSTTERYAHVAADSATAVANRAAGQIKDALGGPSKPPGPQGQGVEDG